MHQLLQNEANGPSKSTEVFYIGDLAEAFGVTARALRFYEEKGLISPSRDRNTRERVYSQADRDRIANILAAKKMGFTLREVRAMLDDWDANLQIKPDVAAINAQIQMLERQSQEINEALAQLRSILAALSPEDQ